MAACGPDKRIVIKVFLLWYFTSRTCIDTFSISNQNSIKFTNDTLRDAVKLWTTNKIERVFIVFFSRTLLFLHKQL